MIVKNKPAMVVSSRPFEFDVTSLRPVPLSVSAGQKLVGHSILAILKEKRLLDRCLTAADIEAIRAQGLTFFQEHFRDQRLLSPRTIDKTPGGTETMLCLFEADGMLKTAMISLGHVIEDKVYLHRGRAGRRLA